MHANWDSIDKPPVPLDGENMGRFQHSQGTFRSSQIPSQHEFVAKKRVSDTKIDGKKMKRVLANRRSARQSYLRRKEHFAQLTTSATALSKQNSDLVDENKKLRLQLMVLQKQLGVLSGLPNRHAISATSHQCNDYPLSGTCMF